MKPMASRVFCFVCEGLSGAVALCRRAGMSSGHMSRVSSACATADIDCATVAPTVLSAVFNAPSSCDAGQIVSWLNRQSRTMSGCGVPVLYSCSACLTVTSDEARALAAQHTFAFTVVRNCWSMAHHRVWYS
jgi:hypothetical protein